MEGVLIEAKTNNLVVNGFLAVTCFSLGLVNGVSKNPNNCMRPNRDAQQSERLLYLSKSHGSFVLRFFIFLQVAFLISLFVLCLIVYWIR
jgi:hypothetical protein